MKRIICAVFLSVGVAAPAHATGGFFCQATDRSGLAVGGSVGRVVGNPIIAASLRIRGRTISTQDSVPGIAIARSWLDERELRMDLANPQVERFEAELRARIGRNGIATGTLKRNGRVHPVRCEFE